MSSDNALGEQQAGREAAARESHTTRLLAIVMVGVAVAVMAAILAIIYRANIRSENIDELETNRAYCETAINELSNASDYLTSEVWQYALSGDASHMENYWNEVNVTRTRDKAIQKLLHSDLIKQEKTTVLRVKAYSDGLMTGETRAMRLLAESYGMSEKDMPAEVRACTLSPGDEALSASEKKQEAQSYLFGTTYEQSKRDISETVQSFREDLSVRLEAVSNESIADGEASSKVAIIATIILMLLLIATAIWYSRVMSSKNRQLSTALIKAEAASSAKSYFTSRMSHEIRTPLNAVLGYLSIAEEEPDPKVKNENLDKSRIAATNLLSIVNDVLDLSAIENGRMKVASEPFSISSLLSDLGIVYSSQAVARNVDLRVESSGIEHDVVVGDRMRTNQILTNLLSNAVKFTPEGGSITFSAKQAEPLDGQGLQADSEG